MHLGKNGRPLGHIVVVALVMIWSLTGARVQADAAASRDGHTGHSALAAAKQQSGSNSVVERSGSQNKLPSLSQLSANIWHSTGVYNFFQLGELEFDRSLGSLLMVLVGLLLLYLGIVKRYEPLLLIPIAVGAILANTPLAGLNEAGGIIYYIYNVGIATGVFPLIIFMGVGAHTDFGPLLANPRMVLLGGAAQFGIFATLLGALALTKYVPGIDFSFRDAAAIGIIGGADGPTAIFISSQLSPRLLGSIAVAAYSYMALVPLIQPPIMRLFTTKEERRIEMKQLRYVGKAERVIFPLVVILLSVFLLPSAAPLIGFFMFGNLMRESGVVERLLDTTQNSLINITTIFLGLGVGSKLSAREFLTLETLGILMLGIIAFAIGTMSGVLMAKLMNRLSHSPINPLIGSAGVSAVPMAARVSQTVGSRENAQNFLLMHAMGPNVAGVIGSAAAAGILLAVFGR